MCIANQMIQMFFLIRFGIFPKILIAMMREISWFDIHSFSPDFALKYIIDGECIDIDNPATILHKRQSIQPHHMVCYSYSPILLVSAGLVSLSALSSRAGDFPSEITSAFHLFLNCRQLIISLLKLRQESFLNPAFTLHFLCWL